MNSINTEEVERLMRVVSEPLRKQWEAKHNDGKSLVELQKAWCEAVAYIESSLVNTRKQLKRVLILSATMLVCVYIISERINLVGMKYSLLLAVFMILILVVLLIVAIIFIHCSITKLDAVREIRRSSEETFKRFQESVRALNPHGIGNTYHDVITADYAYDRLKRLATRTIDAQVSFDAACRSKFIDRFNITHLGNFIQEAEETFDKALKVGVEDFSLPFEKRKTYEEAQAEYEHREIIKKHPPAAPARLT